MLAAGQTLCRIGVSDRNPQCLRRNEVGQPLFVDSGSLPLGLAQLFKVKQRFILEVLEQCVYPCKSADFDLGYPGLNLWRHYWIGLAARSRAGLQPEAIGTPFVIAAIAGRQESIVVQVRRVHFIR